METIERFFPVSIVRAISVACPAWVVSFFFSEREGDRGGKEKDR